LPGVQGRFDHLALDAGGRRLFVAALGNDTLEVVDLAAGTRLKSVAGLRKPTGVVYLQKQNRIGVASANDGNFVLFDGVSFSVTERVGSLDDADNVRCEDAKNSIYVGYGDGGIAILQSTKPQATSRIQLAAHPESFQLETQGPRIFVNVPDARQIAVVDRVRKKIVAIWPMDKFRGNFPMALDETNHRLFVGCRRPARLVALDTETGKPVAELELSGDTDDLFLDAKRQRIYCSCGEGFLDVVQLGPGNHCTRFARQPTRPGARTCLYSPELDRLFLAVPQRNHQEAEIRVYQPE